MINPIIKLQKEIANLHDFFVEHKTTLINEEITKQMIILPFFDILGYNSKNPKIIDAEYSIKRTNNTPLRVDYCLHVDNSNILLEAKAYNKNLDSYYGKVCEYITYSEIDICILTDGREYRFYYKNIQQPFFVFNLTDYSIDDLETLASFMFDAYNNNNILSLINELTIMNNIESSLLNLFNNCADVIPLLNNSYNIDNDTLNRLLSIATDKAIIKKATELQSDKQEKIILKYSESQLNTFGRYEYIDDLNHTIFIPSSDKFKIIVSHSEENYSIEKGNPNSSFFISKMYKCRRNTKGYLIGQILDSLDANGHNNINIYCVKYDDIESFVSENPSVLNEGFINAKFYSRTTNNKTTYILQSNINGVSFNNFPDMVQNIDEQQFANILNLF